VKVTRKGKQIELKIQTIELTIDQADELAWESIGIEVEENGRINRLRYGLKVKDGVIISKVSKNSYLWGRYGIKPGLVLLKINRKSVNNIKDFRKAILNIHGNESAMLTFYSQGREVDVSIPL